MAGGDGIRIFAERVRVAIRKDLHHPAIKIIDRMIHDGTETAVIFSMSLLNVITQSNAQIFLFAPQPHLFRPQHFNVLHGNLGNPIGAPVQFPLLGGQLVDVKISVHLDFDILGKWPGC